MTDDRDANSGVGQPVRLLSEREPWQSPQGLGPGSPHVLPAPLMRPGQRTFAPAINAPYTPPGVAGGPAVPMDDRYHYADMNGEQVVAVGLASLMVLASPAFRRNILAFRNSGTTNLFLCFGNDASQSSVFRLAPNVMILFDTVVPQDDVFCISDAAGGQLSIGVGNYTPGA